LRDERRLRVFDYGVFGKIFVHNRDKVTGEFRRLHMEELNDLYCLPSITRVIKTRRMRRAGYVTGMGERSGVQSVLVGKPEERRALGRRRRIWEDNIKIDLHEVVVRTWIGSMWPRIGTGSGHV
jgi:hypothetical protein